ncbi:ATP-grasp domain-containing protein [Leadbettera azotonutricia]|nr:ATP-grasp domain-containing protein [Leadbettera azotonutricia]
MKIAKEMGLETVAVDADPKAPCVGCADRFEKVDLKDKEGMEAFALSLKENGGLSGVMTAGTDFSATVAWTAEKLNLPGISFEAALNASDKERMRRRFKEAGVPSPEFIIVTKIISELPFPFPAVVKPVDNMGSRGCRRVDTPDDLKIAVPDALKYSRSGRAIVEEYMEGPEFSVDALVYKGEITICGLADRHIFFPPYFIEMGHTIPTDIDAAKADALLSAFRAGVRALGIDNGAAKGDIKLTPKGPMIGEIAARLSGGYMSGWTYPYASGVLPTRGAIQIAMGQKPDSLVPQKTWTCAERAFISIPGKVRSIQGLNKAKAIPGVKDLFMRIGEGSRVSFPENNVSKCGNILSAAPTREEAAKSAETAIRSILIRLEAHDDATDSFLAAPPADVPAFPPDTFVITPEIKGLLADLPDSNLKAPLGQLAIIPFPAFISSSLKDYVGRGVEESLDAVRLITGLALPLLQASPGREAASGALGRSFWAALIRGGYQGAVYYLDNLGLGKL